MTEISRRDIVAGSAALALTAASTSALAQGAKAAPAGPTNVINLECGFITKTIDGIQCRLRAYNGTIPGPVMQIAPGQKLTINLKNSLAPYTYGAANTITTCRTISARPICICTAWTSSRICSSRSAPRIPEPR
jgi:FtsP/CotA-like multicopper oxidase with cupredoxin domain